MAMLFRSRSLTSGVDAFAAGSANLLILVGRILLAWVFVGSAYGAITNFSGSVSYFRSLNVPAPELFTATTVALEVIMSAGLILGFGTRYCAVLIFLFVLMATAIAHRYWEYPVGSQQIGQYNHFLKNISIMGGALLILVTGGGRFSLDRKLAG
ncbi:DoxX family protein [Bradyrhizobium sp. CCGB20]|uniref:DoxX family protein n=1 Tax=Bradyrhizobium sp. CCGB20 TaxID=2949633 RepID=UPI0020B45390|nr:DoxX family protein [Bradyrhizobium sp. CCGB20]MCP3400601.1 DoxX family protein [Bradyrhizobium sp. CCGB20]